MRNIPPPLERLLAGTRPTPTPLSYGLTAAAPSEAEALVMGACLLPRPRTAKHAATPATTHSTATTPPAISPTAAAFAAVAAPSTWWVADTGGEFVAEPDAPNDSEAVAVGDTDAPRDCVADADTEPVSDAVPDAVLAGVGGTLAEPVADPPAVDCDGADAEGGTVALPLTDAAAPGDSDAVAGGDPEGVGKPLPLDVGVG